MRHRSDEQARALDALEQRVDRRHGYRGRGPRVGRGSGDREGRGAPAINYDELAETITPERFAEIIGAEKVADGWRCPLGENHEHGDRNPSFSIFRDGRRIAAKCHGCGLAGSPVTVAAAVWGVELPEAARRLAEAIGFRPAGNDRRDREIIATYDYTDEDGHLLFQVARFFPKGFSQRRPARPDDSLDAVRDGWVWSIKGVPRVLFRLPVVRRAIAVGKRLFVAEGEKDVLAIEAAGFPATCNQWVLASGAANIPRR